MEGAATKLKQQIMNCLFIGGFLGHSDSVVESFRFLNFLFARLFHTFGDDGGSGGIFGPGEGGAGDAPDRIGTNSAGIKLTHTS